MLYSVDYSVDFKCHALMDSVMDSAMVWQWMFGNGFSGTKRTDPVSIPLYG